MTSQPAAEHTPVAAIITRSLLTVAADESVLMTYELVRRAGVHHVPVTDRPPVAVPSTASVADAASAMTEAHRDAVLVIDDEQLAGLVSWRDLAGFVAGTSRPDHQASQSHPVLFSLEPVIELADRR